MTVDDLKLWKPQRSAVVATMDSIHRGDRSGLIVMPTGVGKTATFTSAARLLDLPTLVLVHRDSLIRQTIETTKWTWPGVETGIVKQRLNEWGKKLVVASVQTLHRLRRQQIPRNQFGLMISDEAHRSAADGWSELINYFDFGYHLGATATAERLDGRGLGRHFGAEPLFVYQLRQAIEDGFLVRLRQLAVFTEVDVSEVGGTKWKFNTAELSEKVNVRDRHQVIVEAWQKHARDRKTIVFCVDVQHVEDLTEAFRAAGINARGISSKKAKEVDTTLEAFARSEFQVLLNCEMCTEGYDDRAVSCVVMARPTKSRGLATQCIGRGLRLCPEIGKVDCLVLDVVDLCRKHKLVTACNMLGSPRMADAKGGDVLAAVDEDNAEMAAEAAAKIERRRLFPLEWRTVEVSPWPDLPSLRGYVQSMSWHAKPASPKQITALHRYGVSVERSLTKGEAAWLIDRARDYETVFPTPASAKQRDLLQGAHRWTEGMTRREASRAIALLKGNERIRA